MSRRGRRNGLANVIDTRGSPKDLAFLVRPSGDWSYMAEESLVYHHTRDRSMEDSDEDALRPQSQSQSQQHQHQHHRRGPGAEEEGDGRVRTFSFTRMDEGDEDALADPAERPPSHGGNIHDQDYLHAGRGGAAALSSRTASSPPPVVDPFTNDWTGPFVFQPQQQQPRHNPFTFSRN